MQNHAELLRQLESAIRVSPRYLTFSPTGRSTSWTCGRFRRGRAGFVHIAYDNLSRVTSSSTLITDHTAPITSSTFSFNASNLQIDTETITYTLPDKPAFTRQIDRSQDTLSRNSGWQLKNGSTVENEAAYSYSATDGRVSSISNPQLSNVSFGYTYESNSYGLIKTVTGPAHTVTNTWESNRNVLASKVNKKLDTTTVSSYFYTVNNLGQRTGVEKGGTAFASTRTIDWGYNSKGEVVKADHSADTNFSRAYAYDGIGNRLSGGGLNPPSQTSYTANALNQYTAINSLNPSYDDDGNATAYPLPANINANSPLVWDGENRLISATVTGGNSVTFVYDAQSRRIAETVDSTTTVYIYDGWNPIAEYSTTFALTKTYTWGIDLSGSMQGAGGVGGLLAVTDSSGTHYPTYDGNGNVSEYLDSNGSTVAHYEYDPFGKTTVATGAKASDFAHRFSTKPLDLTTGLYYYGYRFYDPETGRWPSRDPIGEAGGINLYGFVGNDALNRWDKLGKLGLGLGDITNYSTPGGGFHHTGNWTFGSLDVSKGGLIIQKVDIVFQEIVNCDGESNEVASRKAERFTRNYPLWEAWVIQPNGKVAYEGNRMAQRGEKEGDKVASDTFARGADQMNTLRRTCGTFEIRGIANWYFDIDLPEGFGRSIETGDLPAITDEGTARTVLQTIDHRRASVYNHCIRVEYNWCDSPYKAEIKSCYSN